MNRILFAVLLVALLGSFGCREQQKSDIEGFYTLNIDSPEDLKEFFSYAPDRIPFVSAHRGGDRKYFPENCIETFENTLCQVHAVIEVDPRYTKDSVMVLVHDATLDRTTTGKGRVNEYTLEELKKLRLKDSEGNITDYQIPTLDEALEWARSKTILILDRKDVPITERVKKIMEHKAESCAMVIAYSWDEIKECYSFNPDIMMEIMLADTVHISRFEETGVPWRNIVAFVSHNLVEDADIFDKIHENGAMCIAGSSRNHDIAYKKGEIKTFEDLSQKYLKMISDGADIIEADLAIEAGLSLRKLYPIDKPGTKNRFFKGPLR
jgi:glycerophosphoryl diester phosphodiesterase